MKKISSKSFVVFFSLAALCVATSLPSRAAAQKRPAAAGTQTTAAKPAAARATPTPSDFKIKLRTSMSSQSERNGQGSETTQYIKGARMRNEMSMGGEEGGIGQASIMQCDMARMVMINDRARTFLYMPLNGGDDSSAASDSSQPSNAPTDTSMQRRGGVVTITESIVDTGERQQMFGYTARHLKTKMTRESSPDACEKDNSRTETDGWYIDLAFGVNCSQNMRPAKYGRPGAPQPRCNDRIVMKTSGTARPGYLVKGTTTFYDERGQSFSTTTEVLELSSAPLDASLFEPPAGYRQAKNFQEFAGMGNGGGGDDDDSGASNPRPTAKNHAAASAAITGRSVGIKQPGTIRVGVAMINNHTDHQVSMDALTGRLVGLINNAGVEAVMLASMTPDAAVAEAKQKDCDYVLFTDVSSMKQSKAGKVGGMFGRATGVGGMGADKTESKLDFKLNSIASTSPLLQSSATAKEEGDEASVGAALDKEAQSVAAAVQKKK